MRSLPLWLLLAFLSVMPCACAKRDQPAKDLADDAGFLEPVFIPGGVADGQGKVGYLANPKRGIDAVDLESGKLLWHSTAASFPLIVYKDRLLAQESLDADSTRIVALDVANKGKGVLASDPIQLAPTPKELETFRKKHAVTPPPDRPVVRKVTTFCSGRVQHNDLHVIWRWDFPHFTARIDLDTGKVTKLPITPAVKRRPSTDDYAEIGKIAADPNAFGIPQKLPKLAKLDDPQPRELLQVHASAPIHFRTRWVASGVLAMLLDRSDFERFRTFLVLWDVKTGKNLHSSEVMCQYLDHEGVVYPAFHGRYLVRRYSNGKKGGLPTAPVEVFALESRNWSTVSLEPNAHDIRPTGSRLLYVIPNDMHTEGTLKAVELARDEDGLPPGRTAPADARPRILWERPVRLPVYGLPEWERSGRP